MNNNETTKWDTGCPKDCECLGFGHGNLEITTSADDIKREVLEILEAADRATPEIRQTAIDSKDGRDQDGGCPWCGRDCPDAGKPEGCWYPDCPDFPHGK